MDGGAFRGVQVERGNSANDGAFGGTGISTTEGVLSKIDAMDGGTAAGIDGGSAKASASSALSKSPPGSVNTGGGGKSPQMVHFEGMG